ncbi:DNA-binding domain of Mlu1-box binding protein MBP1, partial [Basidiobolus meristosporus CBS 931.73]
MNSPVVATSHVPFPSDKHKVHCAKYSTSLDPRGYIPVYEFTLNEQPILWDRETGYVYWTGIWKAIGREKSEIAKLVDSNPELSKDVKKIRGGFLKIQGTWLPFDRAYELATRTCWYISEDLVPVFG